MNNSNNLIHNETRAWLTEQLYKFNPAELTYKEFFLIGEVLSGFNAPYGLFVEWANQNPPSPYANECKEVWEEVNSPKYIGSDMIDFSAVRDEIEIRLMLSEFDDDNEYIDGDFFSPDDERYGQVPYDYESMYCDDKEI